MPYTQASLNRSVEFYCGQLRNQVKLTRQHRNNGNKKLEVWDYPCVASACSEGHIKANAHSGRMARAHEMLLARLRQYGTIGKKPSTINPQIAGNLYPLGSCAEQHAASKVLTRSKHPRLESLFFGQARRVRDNALIPPCATCKHVFPQLQ